MSGAKSGWMESLNRFIYAFSKKIMVGVQSRVRTHGDIIIIGILGRNKSLQFGKFLCSDSDRRSFVRRKTSFILYYRGQRSFRFLLYSIASDWREFCWSLASNRGKRSLGLNSKTAGHLVMQLHPISFPHAQLEPKHLVIMSSFQTKHNKDKDN